MIAEIRSYDSDKSEGIAWSTSHQETRQGQDRDKQKTRIDIHFYVCISLEIWFFQGAGNGSLLCGRHQLRHDQLEPLHNVDEPLHEYLSDQLDEFVAHQKRWKTLLDLRPLRLKLLFFWVLLHFAEDREHCEGRQPGGLFHHHAVEPSYISLPTTESRAQEFHWSCCCRQSSRSPGWFQRRSPRGACVACVACLCRLCHGFFERF